MMAFPSLLANNMNASTQPGESIVIRQDQAIPDRAPLFWQRYRKHKELQAKAYTWFTPGNS